MSLFGTRPSPGTAPLPVEGHLPWFDGAIGWLNSPPLTAEGLRGRVVLVNFWTYTCINWLRTLPYVRAWADKYQAQGLVVVGVHTPEFDFEHDLDNVRRQVKDLQVEFPVVVDNDYRIWSAFANHYWPACYFVDAHGQIRHHRFGEGDYQMSEMVVQQLLAEAGGGGTDPDLVSVDPGGVEVAADWASLRSPENYLGYERTDNFVSPHGSILETSYAYTAPTRLRLNQWALAGDWTVKPQAIVANQAGGRVLYRFWARDLHLVMAPPAPGTPVRFRVHLDGQPPAAAHGLDVDDQGNGTLTHPRLYQLVRQPGPISERTLEDTCLDAGEPMRTVSRGFKGRRERRCVERPPGQYLGQDFPVLSAGPTPSIDLADWELVITSQSDPQQRWTWQEFRALPTEQLTVDLHCVTHWSKLATRWEGVSLDTLLEGLDTSAGYALVTSYGGYTTNLPLEDLLDGKAWIAFKFDGQELEPEHGGPARLLVPHLYLWKSAKWVRWIQLGDTDEPGFWESLGYHNYGDPWQEQRFWGD